jgi:hypothetical protein
LNAKTIAAQYLIGKPYTKSTCEVVSIFSHLTTGTQANANNTRAKAQGEPEYCCYSLFSIANNEDEG